MTAGAAEGAPKASQAALRRAEAPPVFPVAGEIDRLLVTESGFFLALGWAGDEGLGTARWGLAADLGDEDVPASALRGSRLASPAREGQGAYSGFRVLGKGDSGSLLRITLRLCANYGAAGFEATTAPQVVSEKRLLDTFLDAIAGNVGGEAELHDFLAGPGGADLMALVARHVATSLASPYVETFGARSVDRTFVTVLGDSADPIATQPLLFRRHRIDFGQWVYVCSSREVGARALETARWVAELYDAMITVIVLADEAGFGPACDIGVAHANADSICLVGPDVFPKPGDADVTRAALEAGSFGNDLWGALLFADDNNLAHAGLRFEREPHLRRRQAELGARPVIWTRTSLIGGPTPVAASSAPMSVAAISSAFMGFSKRAFERVGGFSSRHVYEGSEDGDLSLRWAQAGSRVLVDSGIRLLHLGGYQSRNGARRGAEIVNRGLFSLRQPQLGSRSAA